jgi:cation:H+ antiporter
MWTDVAIIAISFAVMAWSSELFVRGSVAIANNYNVPKILIGTVLVGFATAIPEMMVSLDAALVHARGLSIGNALGSYIINIFLVLGITALVRPIMIVPSVLKRDIPLMGAAMLIAFLLLADGFLSVSEGMLLLSCLLIYLVFMVYYFKQHKNEHIACKIESKCSKSRSWVYLFLGLGILTISARFITSSAIDLAQYFGISDLIIGLTIIAVGTSLPELAASITGAMKGEDEIAIGNIIGSNIFGVLGVLAIPGIFAPGTISNMILFRDFGFMIIATVVLYVFCCCFDNKKLKLNRIEGFVFILFFILYLSVIWLYPN